MRSPPSPLLPSHRPHTSQKLINRSESSGIENGASTGVLSDPSFTVDGFIFEVILATITALLLVAIITSLLATPQQTIYSYQTPTPMRDIHGGGEDYKAFPSPNGNLFGPTAFPDPFQASQSYPSRDSKPPGIITALHTKALTNLTNAILPHLFQQLTTTSTLITDDDTTYNIHVTTAKLDSFEITAVDKTMEVKLNGLGFDLDVVVKKKGALLRVAARIDVTLGGMNLATTLRLQNVSGLIGFIVDGITITAKDVKIKVHHKFGWLINPLIGNIHNLALKSIHDALYTSLTATGQSIASGVPLLCDLEQFNGGIDMSVTGDIAFVEIASNHWGIGVIDGDQDVEVGTDRPPSLQPWPTTSHPIDPDPPVTPSTAIVIGFNGETVDIHTRRPLSNVPRGNFSMPLDDTDPARLLSLLVDAFVFNSYYDAWYNRGMQAQRDRVGLFWDRPTGEDDNNHNSEHTSAPHQPSSSFSFTNDQTNPFNINGLVLHTYAIPLDHIALNQLKSYQGNGEGRDLGTNMAQIDPAHSQLLNAVASTHPDLYDYLYNAALMDMEQRGGDCPLQDSDNDDPAVLLVEISIVARPVLTMANGSTSILTTSEQRFVLYNRKGFIPYQLLFTISTQTLTTLTMSIQYDPIVNSFVLVPFLQNLRSSFECTYSVVGPIALDLLNIVLESITVTILLPLMNQQLFKGIDLPNPPDFTLVRPQLILPQKGEDGGYLLIRAGLAYLGANGSVP